MIKNPQFGNLLKTFYPKNIKKILPNFKNLEKDVYVPQGFRYKETLIAKYKGGDVLLKLKNEPLFQSKVYNPTQGDIYRYYKEYPYTDDVKDVILFFCKYANIPIGGDILFQAQRITCEPGKEGLPSVENWHRDNVDKLGIICVERNNIIGGINEIKNDKEELLTLDLSENHGVIFEDAKVKHRVTPINVKNNLKNGFRDVILMSYPPTI